MPSFAIAFISNKRPCAVECCRAKILWIPRDHVTGRIAHRAPDALNGGVRRASCRRIGAYAGDRVMSGRRGHKLTLGFPPLVKEFAHVDDEITHDGKVGERRYLETIVGRHSSNVGAAGPARKSIDRHGAGAAHADATGKAVGKRRIDSALNPGDDVKHGLRFLPWHIVALKLTIGATAPDARMKKLFRSWHRRDRAERYGGLPQKTTSAPPAGP